MTTAGLTERRAQDADGYDFLEGKEVVGRLVWLPSASATHEVAGWWLVGVAEKPDEPLYRVPKALAGDLRAARENGEPRSLWFARTIIRQVREGLLDG